VDNWSRRLIFMKCKTCIWYVEKPATDETKNHTIIGRCRKNAPVVGEGYATVFPTDFCGQYKMDENKI
jgi:hypothetical protein